jgi:uncharacterized protein
VTRRDATAVRLAALAIYPVKACRRTEPAAALLGPAGLDGDRAWMVTRPDGRFLSQRTHPALARIVPRLVADGLELAFAGLAPLMVSAAPGGELREVVVWDDRMTAVDAGGIAAAWLTRALGEPARLVGTAAQTRRFADRSWVGERDVPVSFADGFPILVCSTASLAVLNARLPAPVPMDRFRPNLVIDGLEPFAEDGIRAVRIGGVVLRFVKPCTRCTVPAIDQQSGERSTDPAPALKAFRYDAALRGVTFGVNAVAEGPPGAVLEQGAMVEVLA